MASTFTLQRSHLIYGLCLPLALLLGYIIAEPLESTSMAVVILVLSVIITPLLMRWHHPALVIAWNSAFYLPFLPGAPPAWIGLTALGAIFVVLNRCVDPKRRLIMGGAVGWSILIFGAVVFITAVMTGGIGLRVLGSSTYGGRKYVYLIAAIAGFFVMTSQRIPKSRAALFTSLFFLSGATTLIGDVLYKFTGSVQIAALLVSPGTLSIGSDSSYGGPNMARYAAWVNVSTGVCLFLLARHGVRGILDLSKPWRLVLTVFFLAAGLSGGFRSFIGFMMVVFFLAFFMEGLHRTRHLMVAVLCSMAIFIGLAVFASKLPLTIQRSLSFLPVKIDPLAATAAHSTLAWRFEMWNEVLDDVPRYLFRGKGYVIDPSEMYFSQINSGTFDLASEWAIVAGDYHNGPLSLLIPFGIWGALSFGWFLYVSVRLLRRYCLYGDQDLRLINNIILACFVARILFFVFLVGGLSGDLPYFISMIGLAICLNGDDPTKKAVPIEDYARYRENY